MSIESAFSEFPVLQTRRLVLRQIRPTDAPAIFDIFSDQDVMQFDSHPLYTSLTEAETFIQTLQSRYEMRQNLRWGITLQGDDTVIGTCSFHRFGSGFHCVETGYDLHRAHWGKGIMSEAMSTVLACGFNDLGCHRIEAVVDYANTRSRSLLSKLGFTFEGTLRQRYPVGDRFEDENYYSLLRSEWPAKQSDL
jgi:ribosomal-protein-alanine N-acetyltransferase